MLISRSDVVRVQKSPELISKPYEVPVLRRGGLEETSTLLAGRQTRPSSICLCSWMFISHLLFAVSMSEALLPHVLCTREYLLTVRMWDVSTIKYVRM